MAEIGMYALAALLGGGYLFKNQNHNRTIEVSPNRVEEHNDQTVGTDVYNSQDYYKHKQQEYAAAHKNWTDAQDTLNTGVVPMYYNTLNTVSDAEKVPNGNYNEKLVFGILDTITDGDPIKSKINDLLDRNRRLRPEWGTHSTSIQLQKDDRRRTSADAQPGDIDAVGTPIDQIGGSLVPGREGQPMKHNNMVPFYGSNITQDTRTENRSKDGKLELYTGQFKLKRDQKKECGLFFKPVKGLTNIHGWDGQGAERDLDRYKPNNTGKKNNEAPIARVNVGPGLNKGFTAQPSGGFHDTLRILPKSIEQLRVDPVLESEGRVKIGGSRIAKRGLTSQMYRNRPELLVENKKGERNFTTVGAVKGRKLRPNVVLRDTNRKKSKQLIAHAKSTNVKHRVAPKAKVSQRRNYYNTPFRNATNGAGAKKVNDYGKSGYKARHNNRMTTGIRTQLGGAAPVHKKSKKRMDDKARKTRKQHYIHNGRLYANMQSTMPAQGPSYNPSEWALRTTIRETTEDMDHFGWVGQNNGGAQPAYDTVLWAAPTTVRETTENNDHIGWVGKIGAGGMQNGPEDQARVTIRETTENTNHIGGAGGLHKKHIAWDPNERAKTTIRETTEDSKRIGNVGSLHKKHIAWNTKERARTTIRETTEDSKRIANVNRAAIQGGGAYKTSSWKAKNTNRQFTSNNEYTGTANSHNRKTKSYDDAYNARTNINKELVAKGRNPGGGGPRLGHKGINIEVKRMDDDRINNYPRLKGSTIGNIYNPDAISKCTNTSEKNHLPQHEIRIDPAILDAYKQNPLTHSLHSYY